MNKILRHLPNKIHFHFIFSFLILILIYIFICISFLDGPKVNTSQVVIMKFLQIYFMVLKSTVRNIRKQHVSRGQKK